MGANGTRFDCTRVRRYASRASLHAVALAALACTVADAAPPRDGATVYTTECASCHATPAARVPTRAQLEALPAAAIVRALESGVMRVVGTFNLNGPERVAVAEYLAGEAYDPDWNTAAMPMCERTAWPTPAFDDAPRWNGWGNGAANQRFQPAASAKLTRADVPHLELRWAFAFPGETIAEAQPTVLDGRLFVGSRSGTVYALDARTACVHWRYAADAPVKNSVVVGRVTLEGVERTVAFFGDLGGTAYALDAATGALVWKRRVDPYPAARLMGSFQLAAGHLFVPVTATESTLAADPDAVCCTFRGSVLALDPATGAERWRRYTIDEAPRETGRNARGKPTLGPSGATIWTAPTWDPKQGVVYVGTGENASHPATKTSDAVLAVDVATSEVRWSYQGLSGDAWNMSCGTPDKTNCPENAGPDYDMGSSPILVERPQGRRVLLAAQKSGDLHALDPDAGGRLLWRRKLAEGGVLGGIEWGPATDGERVYVAVGDIRWNTDDLLATDLAVDPTAGGGLVALDVDDGEVLWQAPPVTCGERPQCSPAQTAAVTAIPGVVFSGSMSGHLRAFDSATGEVLWTFDTARAFDTVNGVAGRGGALDATGAVVVDGWVYVVSGYAKWGGLPGNVVLAFSL